jgi:methionyl-tRNA synthetase
MKEKKNIFIGIAWPYANGSLHIGHVAALLPGDILARYHTRKGDSVLMISGSDCHGTPISVRADKEKSTPGDIADFFHEEFLKTFDQLGFSYKQNGLYTATTTEMHKKIVQSIFCKLKEQGLIYKKSDSALYCETDKRFLPDRDVEGTCPHCHFEGARGDQCDNCGRLLEPTELINGVCKICKKTPVTRETEHWYLKLSDKKLVTSLKKYIASQSFLRKNIETFTNNFLSDLHDRAITRDLDWGIPIPIEGFEHKRIYVWFEAVCGYLSGSIDWAERKGDKDAWEPFWDDSAIAYYVYGKDNIPFHTVLWPAVLIGYDKKLKLPSVHIASEYVQIEGKKLSTSRNWAIWLPDMLKAFTQTQIRAGLIYFGPETRDTNFSWKEFQAFNNNSLVATLGNYVQRVLVLAEKAGITKIESYDKLVETSAGTTTLLKKQYAENFEIVGTFIETGKFRAALEQIFALAKEGNTRLDIDAPWKTIKTDSKSAHSAITKHLRRVAQFGVLLDPFIPEGAKKIRGLLGINESHAWKPVEQELVLHERTGVIFEKIEDTTIAEQAAKLGKPTSQTSGPTLG